ncbi:MAG: hypothetical protein ACKOAO_02030 [Oxalobacteraceae bacterium]
MMRVLMGSRVVGQLMVCWFATGLLALSTTAHAAAMLEITDLSKSGEKKSVPINSEEPLLFNIEFFSGWSHCEVAAGTHAATKQTHAWLRCFGSDDTQIAMVCQGNEKQTVVLGHKDNNPKRGSLSLICRSE